jgi:hypothetical protein
MANTRRMAMVPTFLTQIITIAINKSEWAQRLYISMNANYSPVTIHVWGTIIITSLAYWIPGLMFMFVDLTERPKWLMKYKIQPWRRVGLKEYLKICWVVFRNMALVNFPLSLAMGYVIAPWRGMRTTLPLPGALETIGTWWFCVICTEVRGKMGPGRRAHVIRKGRLFLRPPTPPQPTILFKNPQKASCECTRRPLTMTIPEDSIVLRNIPLLLH